MPKPRVGGQLFTGPGVQSAGVQAILARRGPEGVAAFLQGLAPGIANRKQREFKEEEAEKQRDFVEGENALDREFKTGQARKKASHDVALETIRQLGMAHRARAKIAAERHKDDSAAIRKRAKEIEQFDAIADGLEASGKPEEAAPFRDMAAKLRRTAEGLLGKMRGAELAPPRDPADSEARLLTLRDRAKRVMSKVELLQRTKPVTEDQKRRKINGLRALEDELETIRASEARAKVSVEDYADEKERATTERKERLKRNSVAASAVNMVKAMRAGGADISEGQEAHAVAMATTGSTLPQIRTAMIARAVDEERMSPEVATALFRVVLSGTPEEIDKAFREAMGAGADPESALKAGTKAAEQAGLRTRAESREKRATESLGITKDREKRAKEKVASDRIESLKGIVDKIVEKNNVPNSVAQMRLRVSPMEAADLLASGMPPDAAAVLRKYLEGLSDEDKAALQKARKAKEEGEKKGEKK